jgi:hypothetical protein
VDNVQYLKRDSRLFGAKLEVVPDFVARMNEVPKFADRVRQLLYAGTDKLQLNGDVNQVNQIPTGNVRIFWRLSRASDKALVREQEVREDCFDHAACEDYAGLPALGAECPLRLGEVSFYDPPQLGIAHKAKL